MCANATLMPSTSLSPWVTTSRALLSRLSLLSPLRSHARNLTEFHIRPDEPHRNYSPGDSVRGAVVLTVIKPIKITHLTVCLHGFARVYKNANGTNEPFVNPGLTAAHDTRKLQHLRNRHVSIFQDEIALCGDGRLDVGIYEFNFELDFPSKSLPTSIDFERGTISYYITSTITWPTSTNATSTCSRKVSLIETIDIGHLFPPKSRTIALTPTLRKKKRKQASWREKKAGYHIDVETQIEATQSRPSDDYVRTSSSIDNPESSRNSETSENQSDISVENSANSTEISYQVTGLNTLTAARLSDGPSLEDQNIMATIKPLKSGCLPGDVLPVKISIKHTKPIRSMHGIIVTLYRQGRIDYILPFSSPSHTDHKESAKSKHEEYYPKSKTGLGGLSLTSAGSSSSFRKDLAQVFAPLIVDPVTLTAVVHASVRIPEFAFPTICGVPGQIIAFKYFVEVVVDLGGRLKNQHRHIPLLGTVTLPTASNYISSNNTWHENNTNMLATSGRNIVGTESIRREKNVVACSFEVIVGSKDSLRNRKHSNSSNSPQSCDHTEVAAETPLNSIISNQEMEISYITNESDHRYLDEQAILYQEEIDCSSTEVYSNGRNKTRNFLGHEILPSHGLIPDVSPDIHYDESVNEKERLKRAEERLLPSCPPMDTVSSSRSIAVTVPPSEEDGEFYMSRFRASKTTSSSQEPMIPIITETGVAVLERFEDDKQELKRRLLCSQASAPSYLCGEPVDADTAPTAPSPDAVEELSPQTYLPDRLIHESCESLPRYEK
ncbi:BgTH12-05830 [Blumeria graminis f. sp. triticale]|nr:BgTH12-05830 [Blumeria graminis f. sp. triticale]